MKRQIFENTCLPRRFCLYFSFLNIWLCGLLAVVSIWLPPQIWVAEHARTRVLPSCEAAPLSEAVVVLGARVYPDRPSLMLQERLDVAVALYRAGRAPCIVVSGASLGPTADEPQVMQAYLEQQGIPAEAIVRDAGGTNTYQSLLRCKTRLGLHRILVATTNYHLPRALFLAQALGLDARGLGAPNRTFFNMPFNWARESLAQAKAVWNVYAVPQAENPVSPDGE